GRQRAGGAAAVAEVPAVAQRGCPAGGGAAEADRRALLGRLVDAGVGRWPGRGGGRGGDDQLRRVGALPRVHVHTVGRDRGEVEAVGAVAADGRSHIELDPAVGRHGALVVEHAAGAGGAVVPGDPLLRPAAAGGVGGRAV